LTSWWIPFVAVNFPKAARANFSHALGPKVKKIMKNLAARQSAEGGSARRGETM
jgi:hypothetical protein